MVKASFVKITLFTRIHGTVSLVGFLPQRKKEYLEVKECEMQSLSIQEIFLLGYQLEAWLPDDVGCNLPRAFSLSACTEYKTWFGPKFFERAQWKLNFSRGGGGGHNTHKVCIFVGIPKPTAAGSSTILQLPDPPATPALLSHFLFRIHY